MKLAELYEIMDEPRKALELVYQGIYSSPNFLFVAHICQSLMRGSVVPATLKVQDSLAHHRLPGPLLPCLTRSPTAGKGEKLLPKTADLL